MAKDRGSSKEISNGKSNGSWNGGSNGKNGKRGKTRARGQPEVADGVAAPSPVGKNFVLDTNVLLHDPQCLNRFEDNHVCIPLDVLCELDRFKSEQTERGANARSVHRTLSELFSQRPRDAARGVETPGGGSVRLVICKPEDERVMRARKGLQAVLGNADTPDHRILLCAIVIENANPSRAVLVSKDLNLQLKALALGIRCEDYANDKVEPQEAGDRKPLAVEVKASELQRFASTGELEVDAKLASGLARNEYVTLNSEAGRKMSARFVGERRISRLQLPDTIRIQKGTPIRPLNPGQKCFLDALLNPEISLITCYGQAGTGKTLLAVAAGLHATMKGDFVGVTVSRPVVAMGETLGFLPGTLEEKLSPWLQPIFDALEFIMSPPSPSEMTKSQRKRARAKQAGAAQTKAASSPASPPMTAGQKAYQPLLDSGLIEVEALCYIRGRSIPKRFFILDEAQQLTPLEAKTIVTRMARGSKLVMVGDPAQIDNPYVDRRSNGLVYTRDRMKDLACAAHVCLERGERSELAEAGARFM